jgi:hypothetical protein
MYVYTVLHCTAHPLPKLPMQEFGPHAKPALTLHTPCALTLHSPCTHPALTPAPTSAGILSDVPAWEGEVCEDTQDETAPVRDTNESRYPGR